MLFINRSCHVRCCCCIIEIKQRVQKKHAKPLRRLLRFDGLIHHACTGHAVHSRLGLSTTACRPGPITTKHDIPTTCPESTRQQALLSPVRKSPRARPQRVRSRPLARYQRGDRGERPPAGVTRAHGSLRVQDGAAQQRTEHSSLALCMIEAGPASPIECEGWRHIYCRLSLLNLHSTSSTHTQQQHDSSAS